MLKEAGLVQSTVETKRRLKEIKYRGDVLLRYDRATGPHHPLWTLLPMRATACPEAPGIVIDPTM